MEINKCLFAVIIFCFLGSLKAQCPNDNLAIKIQPESKTINAKDRLYVTVSITKENFHLLIRALQLPGNPEDYQPCFMCENCEDDFKIIHGKDVSCVAPFTHNIAQRGWIFEALHPNEKALLRFSLVIQEQDGSIVETPSCPSREETIIVLFSKKWLIGVLSQNIFKISTLFIAIASVLIAFANLEFKKFQRLRVSQYLITAIIVFLVTSLVYCLIF